MVCGLFFCSGVSAVGFGDSSLRSYLGQPLNVQVPISGVPQEDLSASCIHATVNTIDGDFIASPRMEFIFPKLAGHSEHADSATLVNFITKEGITEPAVTLSVALKCGPLMQRSYSLLLDHVEMSTLASTVSSVRNTESATTFGSSSSDFIAPVATKKATPKRAQRTKGTSVAKKSPAIPATTNPKNSIKKKLTTEASSPKDQLKISNEEILTKTNVNAAPLAEKKPVDIEQQRIQENSLAEGRFAAMLRDDPALAQPAAPAASAAAAENEAKAAAENEVKNKALNEQHQKVQQLEMELQQLKLQIQSNSKPTEQHYPMALMVMNVVVLLLLLALLLVVGRLWLSLRKVGQPQGNHWWNSPAENQQKLEGKVEAMPIHTQEEKPDPSPIAEPQKTNVAKKIEREEPVSPPQVPQEPKLDLDFHSNAAATPSHSEEATGGTFNLFTSRRSQSIQIEELSDSTQEAEFWVSINNPKRAIEILEPQSLDQELTMPVTLLYLLDLYRLIDDEDKYTKLSARVKQKFNICIPKFGETVDQSKLKNLEDYEHITSRCCAFWNTNYILPYLESLLIDDREGARIGFDLSVYRDILFLISICKELDRIKNSSITSAE